MNHANPLPCHRALDPECFNQYPRWARQAFAYRLLHVFTPPWLTRRLPKLLRLPLVAPGVVVPPGAYFPPGTVIPPGYTFPVDWFSMDPPPEGIYIPPGYEFPPGWTPEDPLPEGVTIDPAVLFPSDWTPEDPLPDGVTIDPASFFPSGWTPDDPVPDGFTITPGGFFPSGWTPEDPLPDGVTISPLAAFPSGWKPGDPLPGTVAIDPTAAFPSDWDPGDPPPEGVMLPPTLPPEIQETGPTPPEYVYVWEPGQMIRHPLPPIPPVEVAIIGHINDGYITHWADTWGAIRSATTGSARVSWSFDITDGAGVRNMDPGFYMSRSFLYFDLSSLPSGKTVDQVALRIYAVANYDSSVSVQQGTQGTPLEKEDFGAFTLDAFAIDAWSPGWNVFEFDLWGKLYIKSVMGAMALLVLREYPHDYSNVPPAAGPGIYNGLCYAEKWNQRPTLIIVYH